VATVRRIFLASSNPGKLHEFRAIAVNQSVSLELLPGFDAFPPFEESAPTFAENAVGKALHCGRAVNGLLLADDSGLAVDALDGGPGIHSARYAGPRASNTERISKLFHEMRGVPRGRRSAKFICVLALAEHGRVKAVISADIAGEITEEPRGAGGFGYDPIFSIPQLGRTFAELPADEKNQWSHRGRAFRKLLAVLENRTSLLHS
jgi:XTP/dITP diphosphohydrolase